MRLLFVGPDPSSRGGAARSLSRVTEALRRCGHDVVVQYPDASFFPGDRKRDDERWIHEPLDAQARCDEVLTAAAELRPDAIVGWYASGAGFSAVAAARLANIPSLVCCRGNDVDRDFFTDAHGRLFWTLQHASAIATVSTEMAGKVRRLFDRRATFIGNSVDTQRFYFDRNAARELAEHWQLPNRPVLGLFGVFKRKRGLELLSRLDLSAWQVLVIGTVRDDNRRLLPAGARHLPYIDDDTTLRAAYSLCRMVAQPSLHDGMPNVVLEAMACERTVAASPVGGLPDCVEHGVTGVLCRSDDDWQDVLDKPPVTGPAARKALRSPDNEAAEYETLIRSIL